jgi:type III secretory pathway component EscV
VQRIKDLSKTPPGEIGGPVNCLCCAYDIRRHVRQLLEKQMPKFPVLSYQEIGNHAELRTVAVVNMQVEPDSADSDFDDMEQLS